MRTISSLLIAMTVALVVSASAGRQDVPISQRQVPHCSPQSTTPYLINNPVDGLFHCVSQAPRTGQVPLGGATTSTLGTIEGGLTDTTNATSGTVQSTEYTLNSITIPANAFNANGRALEVQAWGTTAANANAKNLKIYIGATAVATVTGSTANAKDFIVSLVCLRTGASTQSCRGSVTIDTGTSPTMAVAATTITDTSAIVIAVKSANTAAAAASATGKGLIAHFIN